MFGENNTGSYDDILEQYMKNKTASQKEQYKEILKPTLQRKRTSMMTNTSDLNLNGIKDQKINKYHELNDSYEEISESFSEGEIGIE